MVDLSRLRPSHIQRMSRKNLKTVAAEILGLQRADRRENQILYYRPASGQAEKIHLSKAKVIGVGGGNRASKTDSCLAELVALATGVFPQKYHDVFKAKFKPSINVRVCIESLTTVLHPIILPKLQWWKWQGVDEPGGEKGHWGWVPKLCLLDGSWERSWSEKLRILRVLCRDPDDMDKVIGESMFQFNSYDQDATDYASGTFHIVHMDEPPPHAIWRENQARVLDVGGRIFLSMTWPDDPSIGVDWIYDEVYEPGQDGADPRVDWIELQTLDNIYLDREVVLAETERWSEETRKVRLLGQPLRFSNRIHPLFTDVEATWCFHCGKNCIPINGKCSCSSENILRYRHVEEFDLPDHLPVAFLLDPHPRKPHMFCWVAVDPNDDLYVVKEAEIDGDAPDLKAYVEEIEESMRFNVRLRLMDPNMGRSPSGARREITWQDEFSTAGLVCDLADDSDVGRKRINQYLKPDPRTMRTRLIFHPRCRNAISQMKRYVWDDFRRTQERDLKQKPKAKYDDYPTLIKYLLNFDPSFRFLRAGAPVITRPGTRVGAY